MIKKFRLNFVYTMDVYADDQDKAAEIGLWNWKPTLPANHYTRPSSHWLMRLTR